MTTSTEAVALRALFRDRAAALPPGLHDHSARVAEGAETLARAIGADPIRAAAAGWGHDLYRGHSGAALLTEAEALGLPVSPLERALPVLLHGPVAAARAAQDWGVRDLEVLDAIRWHTSGHPALTPLGLALFLADKTEPHKRRQDAALETIHALAPRDPRAAVAAFLDRRLERQIRSGQLIDPRAVETRNAMLGHRVAE